jgi:inositol-phosphate phosphatase/L-galactose 1-phosphate phosphatase/histidinol-phosphatase
MLSEVLALSICCCFLLRCLLQGAGGVITDWSGQQLQWQVQGGDVAAAIKAAPGEVLAAGDAETHRQALQLLAWKQQQPQ